MTSAGNHGTPPGDRNALAEVNDVGDGLVGLPGRQLVVGQQPGQGLAGRGPDPSPRPGRPPRNGDPASEARACNAVQLRTPDLLARWPAECPAVRLALAGLAVVFPTDRTLPALTARLHTFMNQHPQGTDIGDYVRFVRAGRPRRQPDPRVTEKLTDAYWTGTARGVPTRARALHLLGQMLTRVGARLTPPRAGQ